MHKNIIIFRDVRFNMPRRIVVETVIRECGEHQWLETFNDSPARGEEYDAVSSLSWNGPERNQEGTLRRGQLPKLDLPTYISYWYYHIKWDVEHEGMVSQLYASDIYGTEVGYIEEHFPYLTIERVLERRGWQLDEVQRFEDGSARYVWTKPNTRESVSGSAKRLVEKMRRRRTA